MALLKVKQKNKTKVNQMTGGTGTQVAGESDGRMDGKPYQNRRSSTIRMA